MPSPFWYLIFTAYFFLTAFFITDKISAGDNLFLKGLLFRGQEAEIAEVSNTNNNIF
jgi:hypothetical protein